MRPLTPGSAIVCVMRSAGARETSAVTVRQPSITAIATAMKLFIRLTYFARRRIFAVVVGDDDSFSTDTSVALIMAKTASPFLRFIRLTEPVVMIEVTGPAAVLMTISETTLSDTICSIVPGK